MAWAEFVRFFSILVVIPRYKFFLAFGLAIISGLLDTLFILLVSHLIGVGESGFFRQFSPTSIIVLSFVVLVVGLLSNFFLFKAQLDLSFSNGPLLLKKFLNEVFRHKLFISNSDKDRFLNIAVQEIARFNLGVILTATHFISRIVIIILMCSVLFFVLGPKVFLIIGLLIVLYSALFFLVKLRVESLGQDISILNKKCIGSIRDCLDLNSELRLYGVENEYVNRVVDVSERFRRAIVSVKWFSQAPRLFIDFGAYCVILLAILVTVLLESRDFSLLVVVFTAAVKLLPAIQRVYSSAVEIRSSVSSGRNLLHVFDSFGTVVAPIPEVEITRAHHVKEAMLVVNSYKCPNPSGFSLSGELSCGVVNFVTGPSGCGKSSFLFALIGFQSLPKGCISLGWSDFLIDLHDNSIASMASISLQRPQLIQGTVAENISLSKDGAREKLLECVRGSHLQINDLQGDDLLDYYINAGDQAVSGGQALRIGVARALYFGRRILILDEPFSGLDCELRDALLNVLKEMSRDMLIIVTSHFIPRHDAGIKVLSFHRYE